MMGRTLKEYIAEQMKDSDFKNAWDDLEFQVLKAMTRAREKSGVSQAELARRCGTEQSVISRLERGAFSKATLETIKKVADAFDMQLDVILASIFQLKSRDIMTSIMGHKKVAAEIN